jgi:hypothetical protein
MTTTEMTAEDRKDLILAASDLMASHALAKAALWQGEDSLLTAVERLDFIVGLIFDTLGIDHYPDCGEDDEMPSDDELERFQKQQLGRAAVEAELDIIEIGLRQQMIVGHLTEPKSAAASQ